MVIQTEQKTLSKFWPVSLIILIFAIILYFCYHIYQGDLGVNAQKYVDTEIIKTEQKLIELKQELAFWQHRVNLLRDGTIDYDTLDEYIRRSNAFMGKKELVIMMDNYNTDGLR
ncbi:septum formation initiator family protein [Bartonella sp. DGB1]|uniref:FtsB family cell division protein n=1 Tax=Bartonella sp. DGB1 TaxID=3239807 RepID=UPI0035246455